MPGYASLHQNQRPTGTGLYPASPGTGGGSRTPHQQRPHSVGASVRSPAGSSTFGSSRTTPKSNQQPQRRPGSSNTIGGGRPSPYQQQPQQQQQRRNVGARTSSHSAAAQQSKQVYAAMMDAAGSTTPHSNRSSAGRADSSGNADLFHMKLNEMSQVRQQIEQLTRKHRENEGQLGNLIDNIVSLDENQREKTKNELLGIVNERDHTIQMLEVFRQEGNTIIRRLHENLRTQVSQNESTLRELHATQRELATFRAGGGDSAGNSAARGGGTPSAGEASEADDLRRRCSEYSDLLRDSDNITSALKHRVDQLIGQLTSSNIVPVAPDESQLKRMMNSDDGIDDSSLDDAAAATPTSMNEDDMRERLRAERRARLETEEKSHAMYIQQQKQIRLLEQRLSSMQNRLNDRKEAGGGGGTTPRGSAAGAPQIGGGGDRAAGSGTNLGFGQQSATPPQIAVTSPNVQQQQQNNNSSNKNGDHHHHHQSPSGGNNNDAAVKTGPSPQTAGASPNNSIGSAADNISVPSPNIGSGKRATDSPTGNPEEDTQMLEDIEK